MSALTILHPHCSPPLSRSEPTHFVTGALRPAPTPPPHATSGTEEPLGSRIYGTLHLPDFPVTPPDRFCH
ncbi:unnamed protein product [Protopolystoma xenopodis]|uniref:Uncharacterized protein n=1 Tax=Protopolystoma xenopodis TaxID=117903 RepID=A0A3S4ZXG7_9PLAT|nr:unnamed protein product [Protopolystoma xenopodis]